MAKKKRDTTAAPTTGEPKLAHLTVTNCEFNGIRYDAKAVESINIVAQGLVENAKALGKLADVFRTSNTVVEAMLRVDSPTTSSLIKNTTANATRGNKS